jgi:hypothetical protein
MEVAEKRLSHNSNKTGQQNVAWTNIAGRWLTLFTVGNM